MCQHLGYSVDSVQRPLASSDAVCPGRASLLLHSCPAGSLPWGIPYPGGVPCPGTPALGDPLPCGIPALGVPALGDTCPGGSLSWGPSHFITVASPPPPASLHLTDGLPQNTPPLGRSSRLRGLNWRPWTLGALCYTGSQLGGTLQSPPSRSCTCVPPVGTSTGYEYVCVSVHTHAHMHTYPCAYTLTHLR